MTTLPDPTIQQPDRKPHLSLKVLTFLVVLFAVMKLALLLLLPKPAAYATDLALPNILDAINKERSLRNLLTLNTDSRLSSAAQSKADDMQTRHYFAHVDPDGNYIWPKIVAAGYTPYLQLGENLAIEFYDTDSLVAAWMNSPTHRENILNDGFRDQGMGMNMGNTSLGQYHSVVVNTFGTLAVAKTQAPAAQTPPVRPPAVQSAATPGQPAQAAKPTTPPPQPATTKPAPKPAEPAPAIATPPQTAPAAPTAAPSATPASTAEPSSMESSLNPRSPVPEDSGNSGDYAMGGPIAAQRQTVSTTPTTTVSGPAVVNAPPIITVEENYQINRYFTLGFGIILLLFLLTDLQQMAEKKLEHVGRKLNNIILLALAIIVIVVMYWL